MNNNSFIPALEEAIQLEIDGEDYYREAADESTDKFSKNLLTRLAEDEVEHKKVLIKKLAMIKKNGSLSSDKNKIWIEGFREDGLKIFPTDPEIIKAETKSDEKNINILKKAIEKEQEAVNLYAEWIEMAGENEEAKKFFTKMVAVEKQHKEILEDYLDFLENPDAGWDSMERWACQS